MASQIQSDRAWRETEKKREFKTPIVLVVQDKTARDSTVRDSTVRCAEHVADKVVCSFVRSIVRSIDRSIYERKKERDEDAVIFELIN